MKFCKIKMWLARLSKKYRESKATKRNTQLLIESCETINVMEFNGHIYVAYDMEPIVRIDRLNLPVTQLLEEARKDYLMWKEKFNQ